MPSGLPPAARTWEVIPESLHRIAHQYAKKRQDFLPLFAQRGAASKRIFQIRAAGTPKLFSIHFSLFIFFTRSCARVKNQGIPPQFRGSPGNRRPRLSLDADRAHSQGKCTGHMHAAGSENYAGHKNQGIPPPFRGSPENCSPQGGYHSKAGRVPGREGFSR